jgi:hypothetical protein
VTCFKLFQNFVGWTELNREESGIGAEIRTLKAGLLTSGHLRWIFDIRDELLRNLHSYTSKLIYMFKISGSKYFTHVEVNCLTLPTLE